MGTNLGPVVSSIMFAGIGIVIFIAAFVMIDKATPYHLWREINEKQNVALAILIGAAMIGISLIIAAAIHG
jgi:uncharacterized membrane protein YjfL (UPF0719 family)